MSTSLSQVPQRSMSTPDFMKAHGLTAPPRNVSSASLDERLSSRRGDVEEEALLQAALLATEAEFRALSSGSSSSASEAGSDFDLETPSSKRQNTKEGSKGYLDELPFIDATPSFADIMS